MLSILIPTYNYNVVSLVKSIQQQCLKITNLLFEIVVYDDGSVLFHEQNSKINHLKNCSYTVLSSNIGRSAIRNLLAKNASYENLLFLDADVQIIFEDFISKYLEFITPDKSFEVVYGGIVYQQKKPDDEQLLRWTYGVEREALIAAKRSKKPYLSFLTLNFLIKKESFKKVQFNENIPNLRYEDLLFSFDLEKAQVSVQHIDNQVQHNGIETSVKFLQKTKDALIGLKHLLDNKYLNYNYSLLSKVYSFLYRYHLLFLITFPFSITQKKIVQNLLGTKPNLFLFDVYRLAYFSNLK